MTSRKVLRADRSLGGVLLLLAVAVSSAEARPPSFDERLEAQGAIEDVYWRHRIWPEANPTPKPPRAAVLPDAAGLTGEQTKIPPIADRVAEVRAITDLPVAVGFGISSADQVAAVTSHADAAIVGSALGRRMGEASDAASEAGRFVEELASGLGRS